MSPNSPYYRAAAASHHAAGAATAVAPTAPVRGPASMLGLSDGPAGETISVEHGVFTSIRSHTGEGYRIITTTPGIKADERAEITRRCPSHGSLCDDSADAVGMSFFTLATERHFIAIHCHAGVEHTARGGQRVYTHFVVLDNAQFGRFAYDAGRVAFAIARAIGDNLVLRIPNKFDALALPISTTVHTGNEVVNSDVVRNLARCLMNGPPRAFTSPVEATRTFCGALCLVPAFHRVRAACTVGVKYSPSRPMKFVLTGKDFGELVRAARGQEHECVDLAGACPASPQALAPWLDFVDRRIKAGRLKDLVALNDELTSNCPTELLTRMAELCDALDRVDQFNAEAVESARARFTQPMSQQPAEAKRLMALHVALDRRSTALSKTEKPTKP